MKIYLVSLPESEDRRNKMLSRGFPVEWIENKGYTQDLRCLEPSRFSHYVDQNLAFNRYKRSLTGGEIGCSASHRNIYIDIIRNKTPLALILEDDVKPVSVLHVREVYSIASRLLPLKPQSHSFICHIGLDESQIEKLPKRLLKFSKRLNVDNESVPNIYNLASNISSVWYTHAYFISLRAAEKIIADEKRICYVADDWQARVATKSVDDVYITNCIYSQDPEFEGLISHDTCWGDMKQSSTKKIYSKFKSFYNIGIRKLHLKTLSKIPIYPSENV